MVTRIDFSPLAESSEKKSLLLDTLATYDQNALLKEEINTSLYRGRTFSVLVMEECYNIVSQLAGVSGIDPAIFGEICFLSHPFIRIQAVENVFVRIILTPSHYDSNTKEIPRTFLPQLAQLDRLKNRFTSLK